MPPTVDDLLAVVAAKGLRLANLFQFPVPDTGEPPQLRWQANITDGEQFWEFGRGSTPEAALEAALRIQSTTPGERSKLRNRPTSATVAPKDEPTIPKPDLLV